MTQLPESGLELAGPDLRAQVDVLRRRWLLVIVVTALAAAVAAVVTLVREPIHRAETKLIVTQTAGTSQATFARTMRELVLSNIVAQNIIQDLRLTTSSGDMLDKLSVDADSASSVITIRADDPSRARAQQIAQEAALVFTQLVRQRFAELGVDPAGSAGPSITVFDPAHVLPGQVEPDAARDIGIGAALGLLLGLLAAFVRDHLDRRLRTRDGAARAFGLPVLVTIRRPGRKARGIDGDLDSFVALRGSLQLIAQRMSLRVIVVASAGDASADPVATGLAAAYARTGARTALVEADLSDPRLGEHIGLGSGAPGLAEVVHGAALDRSLRLVPTGESEVAVLLAGAPADGVEADLLGGNGAADVVDRLAGTYDVIVISAPPLTRGGVALELARLADGTLVVARLGRTSTDDAAHVRDLSEALGFQPLGLVLTEVAGAGGGIVSRGSGLLRRRSAAADASASA